MIGLGMIGTEGDVGLEFFGGLLKASKEGVHEGILVEGFHLCGHFIAAIWSSVPEVSIHGDEFVFIEIFRAFAVDVILFAILHGFYYYKRKRIGFL